MEKTPDILHPIHAEELHPRHYAQSLLRQMLSCGMLSDTDVSRLQSELLAMLAGLWEERCGGESSSMPVETAQDMMTSVLYVVGIELKACLSPEQAVDLLKTQPVSALFEDGLQLIRRKLTAARLLYRRITDNLLETPNLYYRSTVVDGIRGFFRLYRPRFSAQELHITADYPVFAGRPDADGVEFIEQYLRCLEAENAFCVLFRPQDIHRLLCGLTRDYRSVPLNLFEYVLLSALGLALLQRCPHGLDLSREEVGRLYRLFSGRSEGEILSILEKAKVLLENQGLLPASTRKYLKKNLRKLVPAIQNAVGTNTLDKVFLIPFSPGDETRISFDCAERMDDWRYRKLVERLLRMNSGGSKAALIFREVHSLADFLDILSDAGLDETDFEGIINRLPLPVFSVLLSRYPSDAFLVRESERLLYKALRKRSLHLLSDEKRQVKQALDAMQTEDFGETVF